MSDVMKLKDAMEKYKLEYAQSLSPILYCTWDYIVDYI